jgi:hypothetical protein
LDPRRFQAARINHQFAHYPAGFNAVSHRRDTLVFSLRKFYSEGFQYFCLRLYYEQGRKFSVQTYLDFPHSPFSTFRGSGLRLLSLSGKPQEIAAPDGRS